VFVKQSSYEVIKEYFRDKADESMLLYEIIRADDGKYSFGNKITVPEKALKISSERVSVDVRFIIYCIENMVNESKGLAILHNHFSNRVFSPQDLFTMDKILKLATQKKLLNMAFLIYENNTSKMLLKHFFLNKDLSLYNETEEKIQYE
jgi:hypothetical protein